MIIFKLYYGIQTKRSKLSIEPKKRKDPVYFLVLMLMLNLKVYLVVSAMHI